MRLSVRMPLIAGAAVAFSAAVGGGVLVRAATRSATEQATRSAVHSVHAYASAVAAHLDDAALAVEVTAVAAEAASVGQGADQARLVASTLLGRSDVFEVVMLVGVDGAVEMVEPAALETGLTRPGVAGAEWFRHALADGDTVVSDLHVSVVTQAPSIVIATPLRGPGGGVVGVLAGGLRLETFSRFGAVAGPETATNYGYITDRRGLIIAHQANPGYVLYQTDFSAVPAVRRALAGESGSGRWYNHLDGEDKVGAYLPIEASGWAVVYSSPAEVALAAIPGLIRTVVVSSAVVALLLTTGLSLLGRRIIRPLDRLGAVAERVAAGDLSSRAGPARGDVGPLAARFDAMVATLADQDDRLRLRAADLEAANAELDTFAYSVAHDLRSPLRSIDGFSQVLLEDYGDVLDDDGRAHLDRVRAAAQRMGALIDDLLGLSRVSKAELRREPVDLSEVAVRVVDDLRRGDGERRVTVEVEPGLVADADPQLAEIALRNLLDNAWKFTARNADAHIRVGAGPASGWFSVADDGVGFDMALAGRLFTPFHRLHATKDFAGTGIGLATVARVVHRHGGRIRAEGEPGRGATFTFTFGSSRPGAADLATTEVAAMAGGGRPTPEEDE